MPYYFEHVDTEQVLVEGPGGKFAYGGDFAITRPHGGNPGGAMMVVWLGFPDINLLDRAVFAQVRDASGNVIVEELMVSAQAGTDMAPQVTALTNGNFAVAWWTHRGTMIRVYDSGGNAVTDPIDLSDYSSSQVVAIEALAGGGFVVAWRADSLQSYYQVFNSSGAAVTSPALIDATAENTLNVQISALPDGGFVLGWTDARSGPTAPDVEFRRYDANGNATADIVSVPQLYANYISSILALPNGNVAVAWYTSQDGSLGGFSGGMQVFGTDGLPVSAVVPLGTGTDSGHPKLELTADENIVAHWVSFDYSNNYYVLKTTLVSATGVEAVPIANMIAPFVGGVLYDVESQPDGDLSILHFSPNQPGQQRLVLSELNEVAFGLPGPLNAIDWGTKLSNPTQITVYFAGLGEEFGGAISSGWNDVEKAAFAAAFELFEAVCNVHFVVVDNPAAATLKLVTSADPLPDWFGSFNPPGELDAGIGQFYRFGRGWDFLIGDGLDPGGFGFSTIVHELGHALGLAHPHDTGGTSSIMEGVTASGSYGHFLLNQGIYTMMSYNSGWASLGNDQTPYEAGPMALDIAVLQAKYGTVAANTGFDVYVLPAPDAADAAFRCIWDTDGIDWIVASGDAACVIDLRPATLNYAAGGGGQVSYMDGQNGGFTIAAGVWIEHARGGAHGDFLYGNELANILNGEGGADRLSGGAGDDTYIVDTQADQVFEYAGEGNDTVESWADFYLYAEIENLILITGSGAFFGVGNGLANTITGNENANLLLGGEGNDTINGAAGDDSLFGEDGADILNGEGGIDYLVGGLGNDTINGDEEADALYGLEGNDLLIGGATFHTDILVGGADDDRLYAISGQANPDYDLMDGGEGNDSYYVDTGADLTFEAANGGTDTVYANITVPNAGVYLYANVENLVLEGTTAFGIGNELDNQLTGSASGNWLLGGLGNDLINGKEGNDVLFGEGGADTFVFEAGTGGDVIGDFLIGTDKINLVGYAITFAQLQSTFVQDGAVGGMLLANGDIIILHNVFMTNLTAADFVFG